MLSDPFVHFQAQLEVGDAIEDHVANRLVGPRSCSSILLSSTQSFALGDVIDDHMANQFFTVS